MSDKTKYEFNRIKDDFLGLAKTEIDKNGFYIIYGHDIVKLISPNNIDLSIFITTDLLNPRSISLNHNMLRLFEKRIKDYYQFNAVGNVEACKLLIDDIDLCQIRKYKAIDAIENIDFNRLLDMLIDYAKSNGFKYKFDLMHTIEKRTSFFKWPW